MNKNEVLEKLFNLYPFLREYENRIKVENGKITALFERDYWDYSNGVYTHSFPYVPYQKFKKAGFDYTETPQPYYRKNYSPSAPNWRGSVTFYKNI